MICYDCNIRRNRFGMEIKHMGKTVGWVCYKCSRKREVKGAPTGQGIGWREHWKRFITNRVKPKQSEMEKVG